MSTKLKPPVDRLVFINWRYFIYILKSSFLSGNFDLKFNNVKINIEIIGNSKWTKNIIAQTKWIFFSYLPLPSNFQVIKVITTAYINNISGSILYPAGIINPYFFKFKVFCKRPHSQCQVVCTQVRFHHWCQSQSQKFEPTYLNVLQLP